MGIDGNRRLSAVLLLVATCRHPSGATDAGHNAEVPPGSASAEGESFGVVVWSFPTNRSSFAIEDLEMRRPLVDALVPDAALAVNGGFFDTDGRALGLVMSHGKTLSRFSAMSGGIFAVNSGVARVWASEEWDPHTSVDFAIQCRPRLVVDGKPNVKKSDGQRAERTALCVRNAGRTVDVILANQGGGANGPSLYALGHYLASERHCDDALNLDGGPSTGAAYRTRSGTPVVIAPRGPLRHAVVIRTTADGSDVGEASASPGLRDEARSVLGQ